MRHAARQHAHGLHLLRLPELFFQLAPAGNVHQHGEAGGPARVLYVVDRHLYVQHPSALGAVPPRARSRARRGSDLRFQPLRLLRDLEIRNRHLQEFFLGIAVKLHGCGIHLQEPLVLRIEDPHRLGMFFKQQPEFFIFFS